MLVFPKTEETLFNDDGRFQRLSHVTLETTSSSARVQQLPIEAYQVEVIEVASTGRCISTEV
jgi:hypothetical protein